MSFPSPPSGPSWQANWQGRAFDTCKTSPSGFSFLRDASFIHCCSNAQWWFATARKHTVFVIRSIPGNRVANSPDRSYRKWSRDQTGFFTKTSQFRRMKPVSAHGSVFSSLKHWSVTVSCVIPISVGSSVATRQPRWASFLCMHSASLHSYVSALVVFVKSLDPILSFLVQVSFLSLLRLLRLPLLRFLAIK